MVQNLERICLPRKIKSKDTQEAKWHRRMGSTQKTMSDLKRKVHIHESKTPCYGIKGGKLYEDIGGN